MKKKRIKGRKAIRMITGIDDPKDAEKALMAFLRDAAKDPKKRKLIESLTR